MKRVFLFCLVFWALVAFAVLHARAHTQWADGSGIPDAIKKACCGEAEGRATSVGRRP